VLADRLTALVPGSTPVADFGRLTLDVPAGSWVAAVTAVRDDPETALDVFDWLSGVDDPPGLRVVLAVYSARHKHRALLRTRVGDEPLGSLTEVYAGADWHERETAEMFGVRFAGHPGLAPLLLPDGFEGHPLRKDFVLAARVAKAWPGSVEPGEVSPRRRARPLGVPENWERT
jgi:NADH-quinone oxidoreductase subunit C